MSDRTPANKLGALAVILLAIPCIAVLVVPLYNTVQPELFGMPFFYWWQLLWVPLSSLFIGIVYKMVSSGSGD